MYQAPANYFDELDAVLDTVDLDTDYTKADLPDGDYVCRIIKATFHDEKSNGYDNLKSAMIIYNLQVIEGQYSGAKVDKFATLRRDQNGRFNEKAVKFFFTDLTKLGVKTRSHDLPNVVPTLQGLVVELNVKTNGHFKNYFFNKVISQQPHQQQIQPRQQQVQYQQQPQQQYQQAQYQQQQPQRQQQVQYQQQPQQQYQQNRQAQMPNFDAYGDDSVPF